MIEAADLDPLDSPRAVMRDGTVSIATRVEAAAAAVPYLYPALTSTRHVGDAEHPIVIEVAGTAAPLPAAIVTAEPARRRRH